ncbi:histidine kinase [Plectosphaerella plurivora]|uniref:histidine kinase n=1 Tax=Plectosphaerella plurivora TaxID=936078 RepID=A0A9P8V9R5_9PEZI|nr:histidine kinase [Plectosphaerella plurivora]
MGSHPFELDRVSSRTCIEYETLKYFPDLPVSHDGYDASAASTKLHTSADTTLTGLVQLAACQTAAERAFLFVFGASSDFAVAEATSTSPLVADRDNASGGHGHGQDIWLCGGAYPRHPGHDSSSSSSSSIFGQTDPDEIFCDTPPTNDGTADARAPPLEVVHIPDLAKDQRYASSPFATASPTSRPLPVRSYTSVPLKTRRGVRIGVLCVVNTTLASWGPANTATLRHISRGIMTYLEVRRTASAYRRHLRMNRGIGSFLEGHGSLGGWQDGPNTGAFADVRDQEGRLNKPQQEAQRDDRLRSAAAAIISSPPLASRGANSIPSRQYHPPRHLSSPPSPYSPPPATPQGGDVDQDGEGPDYFGPDAGRQQSLPLKAPILEALAGADTSDGEHGRIFSRAANLIREATEIEACIFFDAQTTRFATLSSYAGETGRQLSTKGRSLPSISSRSSRSRSSGSGSGNSSSGSGSGSEASSAPCRVLGFSSSQASSVDGLAFQHSKTSLDEKLLAKLCGRYPTGRIFNFDAAGELQSSGSDDEYRHVPRPQTRPADVASPGPPRPRRAKPWSRSREGATILQAFPGARSVAFVPFRDHRTDRWFASAVAYTYNPMRIFTSGEELAYLRAFGMLAMSETHRAEIMTTQKAKDDVLNSLSHELRSPLHGVVLGIELLQDTVLDVFQGGLLHSIDTCGRTLVDTIDHLLDFTKINNYSKASATAQTGAPGKNVTRMQSSRETQVARLRRDIRSTFVRVSLDALVEEVVESVFTGHTYQFSTPVQRGHGFAGLKNNPMSPGQASNDINISRRTSGAKEGDRLSVSLQIQPGCNWVFETQPGAIRRLLMNIFSNALKYTTSGSVRVRLTQRESSRDSRAGLRLVTMSVIDTGIGIGEDFLLNDLYRPFAQETTLSVGTGLGLSIVKQISSTLGGEVRVNSTRGIGTTASITIPMVASPMSAETAAEDTPNAATYDASFTSCVEDLRGLRVHVTGYTTTLPATHSQWLDMDIVEATCRDWLGMQVISEADIQNGTVPDIILSTQSAMPHFQTAAASSPPCVVVCSNAFDAFNLATSQASTSSSGTYEFLSHPLGPRKLANTLVLAHQRWHGQDSRRTQVPQDIGPRPSNESTLPDIDFTTSPWDEPPSDTAITVGLQALVDGTVEPPSLDAMVSLPPTLKKFLLVDDNHINLKILSAYMTKLGRPFATAVNGLEAVEAFCAAPTSFSCILMDISMPVMDGFEATRRVRDFEREKGLPLTTIFALSGLASAAAQQEAHASGVNTFLAKPVKLHELRALLAAEGLL